DFELPFQLNYQQIPPAGKNIGITALNARRSDTRWDVFVRVEGTKPDPGTDEAPSSAAVTLLQNGKELANEMISLTAGQSQRIVFPVETAGAGMLEVRLAPEGFDSLASDNIAYLDLPVGRPLAVFCPPELESFRHALRGNKEVVLYPSDEGESKAASYDLVITDRKADADLEAATFLFVGVIPDDLTKLVHMEEAIAQVIDWQRSTPLLQHVLLTDVQIADRPVSAEGVRDRDYEEFGYEILAQGRTGPLVLRKESAGRTSLYLLFHTDRSTLPYRVGFPILVSNAVQIAMQHAGLSEIRGQQTGVLPPRSLKPNQVYEVQAPDKSISEARTSTDGTLAGVATPTIGRYTIREGNTEVASIGVSLLTVTETSLATVPQLQFREMSVGAAGTMLKSDHPLWGALAAVGFTLLLVEWWYFQRRPGGVVIKAEGRR
ncbi:MAG TPA: hypothetical protein VGH74_04875, partial [Planctomycetaceae bacterium]